MCVFMEIFSTREEQKSEKQNRLMGEKTDIFSITKNHSHRSGPDEFQKVITAQMEREELDENLKKRIPKCLYLINTATTTLSPL